jgi:hypothetical protein
MRESIGAAYAPSNCNRVCRSNWWPGAGTSIRIPARAPKRLRNRVERRFGKLFSQRVLFQKAGRAVGIPSVLFQTDQPTFLHGPGLLRVYIDPMAVMTGNPTLRPTVSHTLKGGYNYRATPSRCC